MKRIDAVAEVDVTIEYEYMPRASARVTPDMVQPPDSSHIDNVRILLKVPIGVLKRALDTPIEQGSIALDITSMLTVREYQTLVDQCLAEEQGD